MARAPMTLHAKLQRFGAEWTRSVYVGLSNEDVRQLVANGWLERRRAPLDGHRGGVLANEYRLTNAGREQLRLPAS